MGHTWKNVSHMEIWLTLKKWVTYEKISHTCKIGQICYDVLHLLKYLNLEELGHT